MSTKSRGMLGRVSGMLRVATLPLGADQAAIFAEVTARLFGGASTRLARYVPLAQIGAGAHGVVWRAEDPLLRRAVAIKLVRSVPYSGLPGSRDARDARLQREARALAQVQHPNIISVFDVGRWQQGTATGVFVVMELLEAGDLASWLVAATQPWRQRLEMVCQAGHGLRAAHRVGVLHRDFKPSNVLLGTRGEVKVCDFGLARITSSASSPSPDAALTATGMRPGTPAYMPPEQFDGQVSEASDQYAFCVAAFEVMTGRFPFAGETVDAILAEKRRRQVQTQHWPRHAPVELLEDLLVGLHPDPSERWPSMDALLERLEKAGQRRRALRAARAGAVLVGLGTALTVLSDASRETCDAAAAPIFEVWTEQRRDGLRAALHAVDARRGALTYQTLAPHIDRYAVTWASAWASQCQLQQRAPRVDAQPQVDALPRVDAQRECLRDLLAELDAVLVELLALADLDNALPALEALPVVATCEAQADARTLSLSRTERARWRHALSKGKALARVGKYEAALVELDRARQAAEAAGDEELAARIACERVPWLSKLGRDEEAARAAEAAYADAMAVGLDSEAARMTILAVFSYGARRLDRAIHWQYAAWALYERSGRPMKHAVDLLTTQGAVLVDLGDSVQAHDVQQLALARCRAFPGGCPSAMERLILSNLALSLRAMHRDDEAAKIHRAVYDLARRQLGEHHPQTASELGLLAGALQRDGDHHAAVNAARRAIALLEETLGPDHRNTQKTRAALAAALEELGDIEGATESYERILASCDVEVPFERLTAARVNNNIGNMLFNEGSFDEAGLRFERAMTLYDDHHELDIPRLGLGRVRVEQGRYAEATVILERALGEALTIPGNYWATGTARFYLARALIGLHPDGAPPQVAAKIEALLSQAEQDYVAYEQEWAQPLQEFRAWTATRQ